MPSVLVAEMETELIQLRKEVKELKEEMKAREGRTRRLAKKHNVARKSMLGSLFQIFEYHIQVAQ